MGKEGLCITCVNDKTCTFPRKNSIVQCEEFADYENKTAAKIKKQNRIGMIRIIDKHKKKIS